MLAEDLIHESRDAGSLPLPEDANQLAEAAVTGFQALRDWPHLEDALEALPADLDPMLAERVVEALQDAGLVSTVPGDKLLGWPNWSQSPDWCVRQRREGGSK